MSMADELAASIFMVVAVLHCIGQWCSSLEALGIRVPRVLLHHAPKAILQYRVVMTVVQSKENGVSIWPHAQGIQINPFISQQKLNYISMAFSWSHTKWCVSMQFFFFKRKKKGASISAAASYNDPKIDVPFLCSMMYDILWLLFQGKVYNICLLLRALHLSVLHTWHGQIP